MQFMHRKDRRGKRQFYEDHLPRRPCRPRRRPGPSLLRMEQRGLRGQVPPLRLGQISIFCGRTLSFRMQSARRRILLPFNLSCTLDTHDMAYVL